MGIYRVYASDDGESHIEELTLADYPALHSMVKVAEVKVQWWTEPRVMEFHPLPDRRFIIHLSGDRDHGERRREPGVPPRRLPADGGHLGQGTQPCGQRPELGSLRFPAGLGTAVQTHGQAVA